MWICANKLQSGCHYKPTVCVCVRESEGVHMLRDEPGAQSDDDDDKKELEGKD